MARAKTFVKTNFLENFDYVLDKHAGSGLARKLAEVIKKAYVCISYALAQACISSWN